MLRPFVGQSRWRLNAIVGLGCLLAAGLGTSVGYLVLSDATKTDPPVASGMAMGNLFICGGFLVSSGIDILIPRRSPSPGPVLGLGSRQGGTPIQS